MLLLLSGCGNGASDVVAMLKLRIVLPPAQGMARQALVQVRTRGLDGDWGNDGFVATLTSAPQPFAIDVLAEREGAPVHVKIKFCGEGGCSGSMIAESWIAIADAFYPGFVTWLDFEIAEVPTGVRDDGCGVAPSVGACFQPTRCQIGGCVSGTSRFYCNVDDAHFCDVTDDLPRVTFVPTSGRTVRVR